MHAYTASRKFGRGWANLIYGAAEIPLAMKRQAELETDSAGAIFGFVEGVKRWCVRSGVGVYEIFTFPFPVNNRSYRPILKAKVPWVNGGYDEFPPEWGFETRKRYTTTSDGY